MLGLSSSTGDGHGVGAQSQAGPSRRRAETLAFFLLAGKESSPSGYQGVLVPAKEREELFRLEEDTDIQKGRK